MKLGHHYLLQGIVSIGLIGFGMTQAFQGTDLSISIAQRVFAYYLVLPFCGLLLLPPLVGWQIGNAGFSERGKLIASWLAWSLGWLIVFAVFLLIRFGVIA